MCPVRLWRRDKTFDFLSAGETLTIAYDVEVADGHGSAGTQAISFTVTGTNDAPTIVRMAPSPRRSPSGPA